MHLDEKYVKVKCKNNYDLNCIDSKTKYITAHLFVDKRTKKKYIEFLSQIKTTCYAQILEKYYIAKYDKTKKKKKVKFVCDGFENYRSAWSKLFYGVSELEFGIPIACKKYKLKYNNNAIERYNGKLKDRMNARRGEFKSFSYAEAFMNLQHIINNFINPHQQLNGKTPAEKAEIKINLGRMKLFRLIKFMAKNSRDD